MWCELGSEAVARAFRPRLRLSESNELRDAGGGGCTSVAAPIESEECDVISHSRRKRRQSLKSASVCEGVKLAR